MRNILTLAEKWKRAKKLCIAVQNNAKSMDYYAFLAEEKKISNARDYLT